MNNVEFQNLSGSPGKSCNIISFRNTFIMIDCPLDFMSILGYMPSSLMHNQHLSSLPNWSPSKEKLKFAGLNHKESKFIKYEVKECHSGVHCINSAPEFALFDTSTIDISEIDVVLISNYLNMFGLPYLTEKLGFNGVIYLTEPTYYFGKIMMEELIKLIERTPRPKQAHLWKKIHNLVNLSIPRNHVMNGNVSTWLPIFTSKELNSCLSKLKIVNFSQSIDIFGLFEVSAHSSGFCIGSCNWTIKSDHEKIVYISQSSLLTTHPKRFEYQPLQHADVMLLTNLSPSPLMNPDTMLGDFCSHTIQALKNNGNVLVPCYPCGMVYDLIECIAGQLTAANLTSVPIYFISPVAESSLAYANILGEWLTPNKQCKVFIPDEPFIHSALVRAGRLKHFSSVSDPGFNDAFKCPCIVFTSHPSLRFGDVVHFMELWGPSSKNLIVMTEPDFPCQEAINPFLPMAMRILYIPIDTNLNFKQANNLLKNEIRPKSLILHNHYVTKPPANFYNIHGIPSSDLMIEVPQSDESTSTGDSTSSQLMELHPYNFGDKICVTNAEPTYERMKIDFKFANEIIQNEIRPGICFATVNGTLVAKDNKYTLYSIDKQTVQSPPNNYHYGPINYQSLLDSLNSNGFTDYTVEVAKAGKIIQLRSGKALIHLENYQTHIVAADNNIRIQLKNIVSNCLRKF